MNWFTTNAHETSYTPAWAIAHGLQRPVAAGDIAWDMPVMRVTDGSHPLHGDADVFQLAPVWDGLVAQQVWHEGSPPRQAGDFWLVQLADGSYCLARWWDCLGEFSCCRKHLEPLPGTPARWCEPSGALLALLDVFWAATGDLS